MLEVTEEQVALALHSCHELDQEKSKNRCLLESVFLLIFGNLSHFSLLRLCFLHRVYMYVCVLWVGRGAI